MEIGKTDQADTADTARPMSFDATLAAHNANHPENRLTDITEQLGRARAARLHKLLVKRYHPGITRAVNTLLASASPRAEVYTALVVVAGVCASKFWRRGVTWTEMQDALDAARRKRPVSASVKAIRAMKRANRAMRLVDRLVTTGVFRRGEITEGSTGDE